MAEITRPCPVKSCLTTRRAGAVHQAIEKDYGSWSYAGILRERGRKHLAVLTASACVNHHHNNENKGINYA